jgi:hypothetical protein
MLPQGTDLRFKTIGFKRVWPPHESCFNPLEIIDYISFAHIFVLECPLYNSIRYSFLSLMHNVVLGNLKEFYQLDHHVDISRYLIEATVLCHSREMTFGTPTLMFF